MEKMYKLVLVIFGILLLLTSCTNHTKSGNIRNIGMLVQGSVNEQAWDNDGYESLLSIGEKYNVTTYLKENIKTEQDIIRAVDKLVKNGVNLIFGHSKDYGMYFGEVAKYYPNIHFVYLNGAHTSENISSLNFKSHAVGFFGGMVAAKMTKTNEIGIIAAFEWQQEIEGFYEGVKYSNPSATVNVSFLNDWNNTDLAMEMYEEMKGINVDVVYPTGESYSEAIINEASDDGLYAIGYALDQSDLDDRTVLTSTVQHIDKLYALVAERFNDNSLESGILSFDFKDDVISLGKFSPEVPTRFKKEINKLINEYKKTNLLPQDQL